MPHLSNGDVIKKLQTLPENEAFGFVGGNEDKRRLLEELYKPLHQVFKTSTKISSANCDRVQKIQSLAIPEVLLKRFPDYEDNEQLFWEDIVEEETRYIDKAPTERLKGFLEHASQTVDNVEAKLILKRFEALLVYQLFQQRHQASLIRKDHIKKFLKHAGLSISEDNLKKYETIIRRGHRVEAFCAQLAPNTIKQNHIYGYLFFPSIPDSIWEEKGLDGKDTITATQHLLEIPQKDAVSGANIRAANKMSKVLLDYHATIVWCDSEADGQASRKRQAETNNPTQSKRRSTRRYRGQTSLANDSQHSSGVTRVDSNVQSSQSNNQRGPVGNLRTTELPPSPGGSRRKPDDNTTQVNDSNDTVAAEILVNMPNNGFRAGSEDSGLFIPQGNSATGSGFDENSLLGLYEHVGSLSNQSPSRGAEVNQELPGGQNSLVERNIPNQTAETTNDNSRSASSNEAIPKITDENVAHFYSWPQGDPDSWDTLLDLTSWPQVDPDSLNTLWGDLTSWPQGDPDS